MVRPKGVDMDDLSLVGVHDDGEHLLVAGPNGQRFRLKVDDALRAAVRRDRARLSQLQLESEGRLRPKEIQARIRAGETAEDVAATAGLPVEHVRRYEGPVLAEREYVADQARQVRVQRGGAGGTLGDVVAERLGDADPEHLVWDAWRSEDGTWVVCLTFAGGSARWTFNPSIRHVTPLDDEAQRLSEEEPTEPASTPGQRRLASVRERVFDVETSGGLRGVPEEPAAVDLLDTLRERRGRRNRPLTEDEELAGAADPVREAIDSLLSRADAMHEPSAAHPARGARKAPSPPPPVDEQKELLLLPEDPEPAPEAEPEIEPPSLAAAGRQRGPASPAPGGASKKQRRASVPSWDDIVFGQRRD
jgi:hypothetical protein